MGVIEDLEASALRDDIKRGFRDHQDETQLHDMTVVLQDDGSVVWRGSPLRSPSGLAGEATPRGSQLTLSPYECRRAVASRSLP